MQGLELLRNDLVKPLSRGSIWLSSIYCDFDANSFKSTWESDVYRVGLIKNIIINTNMNADQDLSQSQHLGVVKLNIKRGRQNLLTLEDIDDDIEHRIKKAKLAIMDSNQSKDPDAIMQDRWSNSGSQTGLALNEEETVWSQDPIVVAVSSSDLSNNLD
ncbi:hypothetical protein LIER_26758 [Lithospermum erythrorhizon]|uniref:Uncharacterized protein n=1 Tax=Lithospermum erythrorhizon TaxID=34254 RepID=A0AAV3RCY0_LITER